MIPHYRVRLRPSAVKSLKSLPEEVLPRMVQAIDSLAGHTRPLGEKQLDGPTPLYRLRLGGYRLIYRINCQESDGESTVLVCGITHRNDLLG